MTLNDIEIPTIQECKFLTPLQSQLPCSKHVSTYTSLQNTKPQLATKETAHHSIKDSTFALQSNLHTPLRSRPIAPTPTTAQQSASSTQEFEQLCQHPTTKPTSNLTRRKQTTSTYHAPTTKSKRIIPLRNTVVSRDGTK
jgi:hypothetical protein